MQQTPAAARTDGGRAPQLPRTLDTRMPPAPAPGGKVITVAGPGRGPRKGELDPGMLLGALGIAALAAIAWRALRRHGVRRGLV
jgi:hypothetical protein